MVKIIKANIMDADKIAKCARVAYCDEIKKYGKNENINNYPSKKR